MTVVRIEDCVYLDFEDWKEDLCPDFDNNVVLYGNHAKDEYTGAYWWGKALLALEDLGSLSKEEFRQQYYEYGYNSQQVDDLWNKYNASDNIERTEFIMEIVKILFPALNLEISTIQGYDQNDWQEVVYVEGCINLSLLSAYYFQKMYEVYTEDANGEIEDIRYIPHEALMDLKLNGTLKEQLRQEFNITNDFVVYQQDNTLGNSKWTQI